MKKASSVVLYGVTALFVLSAAVVTITHSGRQPSQLEVSQGSEYTITEASGSDSEAQSVLININTASSELLCTLPGVGEVTAQKIIDYRRSCGKFESIADLIDVDGIGLKTFEALRDKITC